MVDNYIKYAKHTGKEKIKYSKQKPADVVSYSDVVCSVPFA